MVPEKGPLIVDSSKMERHTLDLTYGDDANAPTSNKLHHMYSRFSRFSRFIAASGITSARVQPLHEALSAVPTVQKLPESPRSTAWPAWARLGPTQLHPANPRPLLLALLWPALLLVDLDPDRRPELVQAALPRIRALFLPR